MATGRNTVSAATLVKSTEAPQETNKQKDDHIIQSLTLGYSSQKVSKNTNSKHIYNTQPMFSIVYNS